MHHWDDHDPGATVEPRDGSRIHAIENSGKNTSERACRALFEGQVDALGVTESQLPILFAQPRELIPLRRGEPDSTEREGRPRLRRER